jgi:hypothetical protein
MMPHERRLNTRKPLEQLAYLSLPSDNGGIVLDVSEGGLGFHAIAPVDVSGPIEFKFEIDADRKITAVGELAWKDPTGKSGGFRFTQLPDETRRQIRQWADETAMQQAAQAAARAIAKAISTAVEVSDSLPPSGAEVQQPNWGAEAMQAAKTPPAEDGATTAAPSATNGRAAFSASLEASPKASPKESPKESPKISMPVAAAASPSLSGKPEVARVVNAPAKSASSGTTSLGGANGKAEVPRRAEAALTAPVAAPSTVPNVNQTEPESAIVAAIEEAASDLVEAPIDPGIDWVREANVLVSARAAGVDDTVTFTPSPAPVFTRPATGQVDSAEVPPSASADVPFGRANKTQLLYNRKPPIYSSPAYEFSMFTPEAGPEAPVPIPTMLGALESAIAKHPFAAVGMTAALAFLVSIGIFSYLCAGPAGDALANTGEKIWGGMYSHSVPAQTAPASSADPAKALQQ